MIENLVSVTDAKAKLPELVRLAGENTRTILTRHGHAAALIVGLDEYEGLLEEIEDLRDRLSVYESDEAGPGTRMPFEKALLELGIAD